MLARAHLERFRQIAGRSTTWRPARDALATRWTARRCPRANTSNCSSASARRSTSTRASTAATAPRPNCSNGALARADAVESAARELIFEWWAGALDRQAQYGPAAERKALYQRILRRSEDEAGRERQVRPATYWLAAAARGVDDVERAWGAAMAGWVRAALPRAPRAWSLRADLDKLVTDVLLPERARQIAPDGDARSALDSLDGAVGRDQEEIRRDVSPEFSSAGWPLTSSPASVAALPASSAAST